MSIPGVAEGGDLPKGAKVLSPNAEGNQLFEEQSSPNPLDQFGKEMDKPNAGKGTVEVDKDGKPIDPALRGRYEYHQSRADKAEADLKTLQQELAEKSKFDPLVDLIRSDDEAFQFVQNRLKGDRSTPAKPLEPPQKPEGYNEVEAYSNPDSASFKHRRENDNFREGMIKQLQKQQTDLLTEMQRGRNEAEQRAVQQKQMAKFQGELIGKGIAEEKVPEAIRFITGATIDDMVEYLNFKFGSNPSTIPDTTQFRGPLNRSISQGRGKELDMDISKEVVSQSRML